MKTASSIPFFLLVNTVLAFALNWFEKPQAVESCFSKKFLENPRKVSIKRKKGSKNSKENSFTNSRPFGVVDKIIKGRL